MLNPYKFVVQAVAQSVEGDVVVGEVVFDPIVVYGCKALEEWAQKYPDALAEAKVE